MTDGTNTIEFNTQTEDENPLSLSFDATAFMHFLDETDWSEEQKAEYLALIWEIVCEFVALGFDIHPIQQAQKACGKSDINGGDPAIDASDVVSCIHSELMEEFVSLNGLESDTDAGGVTDE